MQDYTYFHSSLLRSTLCGSFESKYTELIKDIMQENTGIGDGFFKASHEYYVLKGYQEGSGPSSIGRHLLTQMVQDIFGETIRNESEYMLDKRDNWGFTQAIQAIKETFSNEYKDAIAELEMLKEKTKQLVENYDKVVDGNHLSLYRRLPTHELAGLQKENNKVWLQPNLIASYSFTNNFENYPNWSDYTIERLVPIEQIFLHSGLLDLPGFSTVENEVIVINPEIDLKMTTKKNEQRYQDYKPELVRILKRTSQ